MYRFKNPLLSLIFVLCTACGSKQHLSIQDEHRSYQVFIDALSPYGTWLESSSHGLVWHPFSDASFRPYLTGGNWVSTTEGWAWASDYEWGWAPFHYGRWYYDNLLGWLWQPGYDWAPAWVTWGTVDDYYCWAPLMPGITVTKSSSQWKPPAFYWNACHRRNVANRNLEFVAIKPKEFSGFRHKIKMILNFETTRSNMPYASGPIIDEVNRHLPRKLSRVAITDRNRPAKSKVLATKMRTYRPVLIPQNSPSLSPDQK